MEPKKIRIKPIVKQQTDGSVQQKDNVQVTKKKQDALTILENTIKKLSNRFEQYGFNDSKEEDFLNENKGKQITIELQDKQIEGILENIDKYRICINLDGTLHYFYKHAIIGYNIKK